MCTTLNTSCESLSNMIYFGYDLLWLDWYRTMLLWYLFDILLSIHHGDKLRVISFSFNLIVCVWFLEDFHVHLFDVWILISYLLLILFLILLWTIERHFIIIYFWYHVKLNWSLCCCFEFSSLIFSHELLCYVS